MTVGAAGDAHESDADATASAVLSGGGRSAVRAPAAAQREAAEEDEVQARHDLSVQRDEAPEEEEVQAKHDLSIQRDDAPEEDEVQAKHDCPSSAKRRLRKTKCRAMHDTSLQRGLGRGRADRLALRSFPGNGRTEPLRTALNDGTSTSAASPAWCTRFSSDSPSQRTDQPQRVFFPRTS